MALGELAHLAAHISRIDPEGLAGAIGCGETDLFQQSFEHRMQAARTDVFHRGVDLRRQVGDRRHRIVGEFQGHILGRQQRLVLTDQAHLRLRQDAHKVIAREGLEFHTNRQAALQLRQQVRRLGEMKRA